MAVFNPAAHTNTSKPIGLRGRPLDARTYYYDEGDSFRYRPYTSLQQVFDYLPTVDDRRGNFEVIVNTGGSIVNGYIVGGTNDAYWFKNGLENANLVLKVPNVDLSAYDTANQVNSKIQTETNRAVQAESLLQPKTDNSLNTSDKTIVGGINLVKATADSADAKAVVAQEDAEDAYNEALLKIPLTQKNKTSGVPSLASNTISYTNTLDGLISTFKPNSSITPTQIANFPEWYREDEAQRYKRTDIFVTPENFGAYGDGLYHPLSEVYNSLSSAQSVYPFATNLNQSIDCMAAQKGINYLAQLGSGTLKINDNSTYNFNLGSIFITTANINVIGSGTIKNGTIDVNGSALSTTNRRFYAEFSGFKTKFDILTPSEFGATNAGIRLQYCSRLKISDIYFENCEACVHVVRRNVTQHVARVTIIGCTGQYANNHIFIDGNDTLDPSFYEIGDFNITNNYWVWAYYTQIHAYGVDGLRISNSYFFSFPPDGSNLATKKYNIDIFKCNFSSISDCNLFEAGLDAVRVRKFTNLTLGNLNIAWPGQRKPAGGINMSGGNISVTSGTLDNISTITNVNIERPSKYGISIGRIPDPNDPSGNTLIDDPNPMGKLHISGMITSKVGNLDKYYGTDPIGLTSSIYTSATTSGIYYEGINDSSQSRMIINGTKSIGNELQTFRGVNECYVSPDIVNEDNSDFDIPYNFIENYQPASNRFDLWSLNSGSVSQAVTTETESTSHNVNVYKITESDTDVQHVMIAPVAIKTGGGIFTTTFKVKAKEIQALELCIGSSVGGIGLRIDVNIEAKKTIGLTVNDTSYAFVKSNIKAIENGFCYIRLTYSVPDATPNIQLSIYLKRSTTQIGNPSYLGNGLSSFYMTEVQTSKTKNPLPFLLTGSAQILRSSVNLFSSRSSSRTESFTGTDDIVVLGVIASNKSLTLKNPALYVNKIQYIENSNNNAFAWLIVGSLTDANGNAVTQLLNQSKYILLSNGTSWVVFSVYTVGDVIKTVTINRTLTANDYGANGQLTVLLDATTAAFTLTLPSAASVLGLTTNVVKTDASANTITIKGNGTELINNANTDTTLSTQNSSFILKSNGTKHFKF